MDSVCFVFVYINEWLHVLVQWCISAVFNAEPFICMSEPLGNVAAPAKADVCYLLMFFYTEEVLVEEDLMVLWLVCYV